MKYPLLILLSIIGIGAATPANHWASVPLIGQAQVQSSPEPLAGSASAPVPHAPAPNTPQAGEIEIRVSVSGKKLTAASKVKPGNLVCLTPENVTDSRWSWDIRYPVVFEEFQEENGKLFLAMPNQNVGVTLFVMPNDKNLPIRKVRTVIECDSSKVKPDPVPDDQDDKKDDQKKPDPKSTEIQKTDYLVLVEESSERSTEVARVVNSIFWQVEIARDGFNKPLIHDDDSDEGKAFIEETKRSGSYSNLPFLAVIDKDGRFIRSFPMVKSVDELREVFGQ